MKGFGRGGHGLFIGIAGEFAEIEAVSRAHIS